MRPLLPPPRRRKRRLPPSLLERRLDAAANGRRWSEERFGLLVARTLLERTDEQPLPRLDALLERARRTVAKRYGSARPGGGTVGVTTEKSPPEDGLAESAENRGDRVHQIQRDLGSNPPRPGPLLPLPAPRRASPMGAVVLQRTNRPVPGDLIAQLRSEAGRVRACFGAIEARQRLEVRGVLGRERLRQVRLIEADPGR